MMWSRSLLRCFCVLTLVVFHASAQIYQGFQRPTRQDVDVKIYEFADPFQDEYSSSPGAGTGSSSRFGGSSGGPLSVGYNKMRAGGAYGGGFNSIPNQNFGAKNSPIFEFFNPSGVGMTLPGPHEESNIYLIKFYVSVNQQLQGRSGQYTGQVTVPQGSAWSFTIPSLSVKYLDTLYYLVEVQGQQGYRSWNRDHRGYYQIPLRDPHGSQSSQVPIAVNNVVRPQSQVQNYRPQPQEQNYRPQSDVQNYRPQSDVQNYRPQSEVQNYRPSVTYTPLSSDGAPNPKLEFFEPQGVRITVPGPIDDSNVYVLKYHLNVNRDFNGVKKGQYNGELSIQKGSSLSFLEQSLRIQPFDTLYYWLEILGQNSARTWFKEYKGYYQLPNRGTQVAPGPLRPSQNPPPTQTPLYQTYPTNPPTKVTYPTQAPTYPTRPPTTVPPRTTLNYPNRRPTTPPPAPQYPQRPRPTITTTSTTTTTTRRPEACKQSTTTYNGGSKLCAGSLLDQSLVFNSVEQIAGVEPEESFTVFCKDNVVSNGGKFKAIRPSLLEEKYGDRFVDKSLTLQSCTSKNPALCSAKASGYFILPPVLSGRQTTEDTLYFRYGILEVTAKLPSGDWVVPELWLLPKARVYGRDSGKIVLAMTRGNAQLYGGMKDYSGHVLEAGVQIGSGNRTLYSKVQDRPWSDDYHTFRLDWLPDEMVFYVDNKQIGRITPGSGGLDSSLRGTKLAPFDQEFFLVYGIHVGGDQGFPDTITNKPWKNLEPKNKLNFWRQRSKWHPSWSKDTMLHISDIKLTALDY